MAEENNKDHKRSTSRSGGGAGDVTSDGERPTTSFASRPESVASQTATAAVPADAVNKSASSNYDILKQQLKQALNEISRQKLRNIQIHMRRIANVDSRVKSNDLWDLFMEHNLSISKKTFQLLLDHFSDPFGIEYESILKLMRDTHSRTGRDSVQAKYQVSRKEEKKELILESDADAHLLEQIRQRFKANTLTQFSLSVFEEQLEQLDYTKSGVLSKKEVRKISESMQLPIYGQLISQLYNRCDRESNSQISWPLLMNFLEAAIGGANCRVTVTRAKEEEVKKDTEMEIDQTKIDEFKQKQQAETNTKKAIINEMFSKGGKGGTATGSRPASGKSLFAALKTSAAASANAGLTSGSETEPGGTNPTSPTPKMDLKTRLQKAAALQKEAEEEEAKSKAVSSAGSKETIKVYQKQKGGTSSPGTASPTGDRSLSPSFRMVGNTRRASINVQAIINKGVPGPDPKQTQKLTPAEVSKAGGQHRSRKVSVESTGSHGSLKEPSNDTGSRRSSEMGSLKARKSSEMKSLLLSKANETKQLKQRSSSGKLNVLANGDSTDQTQKTEEKPSKTSKDQGGTITKHETNKPSETQNKTDIKANKKSDLTKLTEALPIPESGDKTTSIKANGQLPQSETGSSKSASTVKGPVVNKQPISGAPNPNNKTGPNKLINNKVVPAETNHVSNETDVQTETFASVSLNESSAQQLKVKKKRRKKSSSVKEINGNTDTEAEGRLDAEKAADHANDVGPNGTTDEKSAAGLTLHTEDKKKKRRRRLRSSVSISDRSRSRATSTEPAETEDSGKETTLSIKVRLPSDQDPNDTENDVSEIKTSIIEVAPRNSYPRPVGMNSAKGQTSINRPNMVNKKLLIADPVSSGQKLSKRPQTAAPKNSKPGSAKSGTSRSTLSSKEGRRKASNTSNTTVTSGKGTNAPPNGKQGQANTGLAPVEPLDLTEITGGTPMKLPKMKKETKFKEPHMVITNVNASKITPSFIKTRQLQKRDDDESEFNEPIYPPAPKGVKPKIIEAVSGEGNRAKVKVWPPDSLSLKIIEPQVTDRQLKLQWIYGYRGIDGRNNLHLVTTGELIYCVSTFVILMDPRSWVQRIYTEHKGKITSLAVHSDGVVVASGQEDQVNEDPTIIRPQIQKACVKIWDCVTLNTLFTVSHSYLKGGVAALTFTNDKNYLLSVNADNREGYKHLCVWNSSNGTLLQSAIINVSLVCSLSAYLSHIPGEAYDEVWISTGGKDTLLFHTYDCDSNQMTDMEPNFGNELRHGAKQKEERAPIYVCSVFDAFGYLYIGDSNGKLTMWDPSKNIVATLESCHEGALFTILVNEDSTQMMSGGRDGTIHVWDISTPPNFNKLITYKMPDNQGACRMLALSNNQLYVGSTANSILNKTIVIANNNANSENNENAPTTNFESEWSVLTQGHYEQIRGLTSLRNGLLGGHFITAGYDGMVLLFNSEQKRMVWKHALQNTAPTCIDIHEDATTIAMGTKDGSLILVKVKDKSTSSEVKVKVAQSKINCIKFSNDYSSLALGSQDGNTYIFRASDFRDFERTPPEELAKLKGSGGSIMSLDWSTQKRQGQYIVRTLTEDGILKYWNAGTGEQWMDSEMRSVEWMSIHCKYEYNTSGLFEQPPPPNNTSTYSIVSVSRHTGIIAAGTDKGNVLLATYPCLTSSNKVAPKLVEEKSFQTKISEVELINDNCLIVSPASDHCIQQWRIQ
ncbi:uncharacterized protein LOC142339326 isoform X2 [Convolutriloba macropyga]|uniref:uncharacterized protein LOC142339326 isoform X2 n=1 Tax=Convolutriloba macropyga TaxID=536237 RepID=UPI003F52658F